MKRFLAEFSLVIASIAAAISASVVYAKDYCKRVREDLSKSRFPSNFSMNIARSAMAKAIQERTGKTLNGGQLLQLGGDHRIVSAIKKAVSAEGHKFDRQGYYAWPKEMVK